MITAVRVVVGMLVAGEYDALASMTRGVRLSSDALETAVKRYGRTLRMPPDDAFSELDVVEVSESATPTYTVTFDLWTAEEGRSDLSLELLLRDAYSGAFEIEVTDLHVL